MRRERQSKRLKTRHLTRAELRALGATPGLLTTRYSPDGERATVEQLAPESDARRRDFARRLTDSTPISTDEESK